MGEMYKAADRGAGSSPRVTAEDDNSRGWTRRPGAASFIAAMLTVKPSIMSFPTAHLSVWSPGLG